MGCGVWHRFFAVLVAAGVIFVAGATEVEAEPAPYSQVVDNTTKGRFEAGGVWGESSYGRDVSGEDYRFARPGRASSPAMFRVRIPTDEDYAVYARWPKVKGLNASVPVGVSLPRASSGRGWTSDETAAGGCGLGSTG